MSALDIQSGGSHYKSKAIQPIEYILANNLNYIEGCIVKYISRHRDKGKEQDIRKIIHYCELMLELEYNTVGTTLKSFDIKGGKLVHPTYEPT